MAGDARVVDASRDRHRRARGSAARRAVRQPVRAVRREAHAARAPRPDTPVTVLQRFGLPDEHVGDGAARGARPHASFPITSRRCTSTPARWARPREMVRLLPTHQAAARSGRVPVGRRADAPVAHPLPARGDVRGGGGGRGAPGRRPDRRARPTPRSKTSWATSSTRWCSTRCSRRRPTRSRWPTSPAASTTSSCAATRTCSATSSPTRPSDVMRNWEQIKKEEKGDDVDRRRHHARTAVAPLHPQAVPQGGVDRARSR